MFAVDATSKKRNSNEISQTTTILIGIAEDKYVTTTAVSGTTDPSSDFGLNVQTLKATPLPEVKTYVTENVKIGLVHRKSPRFRNFA